MTATEGLTTLLADRLRRQLDEWRRELLALDRRQRLLYFSHTRTASLELVAPALTEIAAYLDKGRMPIAAIVPEPENEWSPLPRPSTGLVVGNKTEAELQTALRRLDQQSQQVYADRGFWTLYVSLGMVQWVDPDDHRTVVSPLLLVPVTVRRSATHRPYDVRRTEDDVVINPVLRLKLEHDFGIELPEQVDPDDHLAIDELLEATRERLKDRPGWDVLARAVMTTFSFHKEAIYRDLRDHEELVAASPLVQLVALGPDAPSAGEYAFEPGQDEDLDEVVAPEELLSILDADGSQRKCILAARDGRSFVMDGPPGTGKSQTIANIVVELMAMGRSVLFVSEKAAALDVVRRRLKDAGLEQFLLELHSHAATRKHVAQTLGTALSSQVRARHRFSGSEKASLRNARQRLTGYAAAMNEQRAGIGRSLHQVLGRLAELHDIGDLAAPVESDWAELDGDRLDEIERHAESLSRSWRPVSDGVDFLWRDLATADLDGRHVAHMSRAAGALAEASTTLAERVAAVDADLGLALGRAVPDVQRRRTILQLLVCWPSVPTQWLAGDLAIAEERARWLRAAVDSRSEAIGSLERAAGSRWSELDGESLGLVRELTGAGIGWRPHGLMPAPALSRAVELLAGSPDLLVHVEDDARRLAATFAMPTAGISAARAAEVADLAGLGAATARPEPAWINPAVQAALDESARVLGELVELVRQRERSLATVFTRAALDLDLAALRTRFVESHHGLGRFSSQARADRKALREVTVTRKANRAVLERLDEAVAWQQVERALTTRETEYAPRLGRYYRRTDTDFGRVAAAVDVAHRAVRLAGADLDAAAVAGQLALDGITDPSITALAERLSAALRRWRVELTELLGRELADWLASLPLIDAAQWCADRVAEVRPAAEVVRQVAGITGRPVTVDESVHLLGRAAAVTSVTAEIFDAFESDERLLGPAYRGLETEWAELTGALDWAHRLVDATRGPIAPMVVDRMRRPTFAAEDVAAPLAAWELARDDLLKWFSPERASALGGDLDADVADAGAIAADMFASAATDIDEWARYVDCRGWLQEAGVGPVVDELAVRRAPAGVVANAVERAALGAWAAATARADARLVPSRADDRDALVDQFRRLDARLVADAHAAVIDACNARRPRSVSRAAATIKKEAEKKTRHKPIRQLLAEAGEVALNLKPCFMMSPLSVSQYLPPDFRFDVVIFDEASQVLPSDAINCVYRGAQLIVAGDQKQLPPTSFFARAVDDEIEDEDADLDKFQSVLDLCKAAGALQSLPLNWHYRSRHESLITYSNYRFYGGRLHTFPGATYEASDLGIEAFYVPDGEYRRGGARNNPVEAAKVAQRVLHHHRAHPDLSIGVVTFSGAQEDAVLAEIEALPELSGLLTDHDRLDGFFVKNLENVQGDERDVIIFSVGYGPDEFRKFTMNFGPLNREGGWRRLNVAVTRARRRVEIVSSFRSDEIIESQSEGVRHLRGYLDFAERGMAALAVDIEADRGEPESPFEEDVARAIADLGYQPVSQVGAAGYRIDVGIKHPDRPGSYLLAVECDGAAYHSAKAARDRDRLREAVLRGLGWHIHRIWGISWVRDREGQIQRLQDAIEQALRGRDLPLSTGEPSLSAVEVEVEPIDLGAPPTWAVPYRRSNRAPRQCPYPADTPEARPYLRAYVEGVFYAEAPVHEDVLLRGLREDWNIGHVGRLIRSNVHKAAWAARVDGARVLRDESHFYRVEGHELEAVRVPTPSGLIRTVGQIPPEELDLAIGLLVRDAIVADDEQVGTAASRLFGWARRGDNIQFAVTSSISRLLAQGRLERAAGSQLRYLE